MAGQVAVVDGTDNADNLAEELIALYSRWKNQKLIKESEWRELRNYIFATDTSKTIGDSLPWKNKTTIPKLTQIRDNLHAHYMDAIFPNDEWLIWEGDDPESVEKQKVDIIQAYMRNKTKLSGFRETVSLLLYDYIDYGNAFCEVQWHEETHIDPITGQPEPTYVGPKLVRLSPYDIVFNPTAISFEKSPKFTRSVKGIGELIKEMRIRTDLDFNESVVKKATDLRRNMMQMQVEDVNKSEGISFDGFGSLYEYYQSGLVEIIEFEGDFYDQATGELHENRIITIIDRKWILRDIPNPNWLGTDSKIHVGWRERPDNLWSMGPLDNLVGLQYRLDHLENLKADALDLTILPPIIVKGDVEPFEWAPKVTIHLEADGEILQSPPSAGALAIDNEIGFLMNLMEEIPGAPKQALGIRSPGEKTKFEVQTLDNATQRVFLHKTNKFEIGLVAKALNMFLEQSRRNLSSADVVRVIDDDFGVQEFLSITREDITAKGKLRPVGSKHFAAQAQLMQNLQGLYSANSGIAEIIKPHTSGKAITRLVEDAMGIKRFGVFKDNVAVQEAGETQKLMNATTESVQQQGAQPVEEELIG